MGARELSFPAEQAPVKNIFNYVEKIDLFVGANNIRPSCQ